MTAYSLRFNEILLQYFKLQMFNFVSFYLQ